MDDYAGGYNVRSEHLLQAGIKYLNDLKELSLKRLRCTTAHELMRTLEVFDALELGELVCWSALERKETRGNHVRVDYPFYQSHPERLLCHGHKGAQRACNRHSAGKSVISLVFFRFPTFCPCFFLL